MTEHDLVGKTCGRFEIRALLGAGGMGIVYKAYQPDLERMVALKVLRPELTHDDSAVRRFLQEARSAAKLEHPHIVPIYEVGTFPAPANAPANAPATPPLHAIVMKYIQGQTLKAWVQEQATGEGKGLPLAQVLDILAQTGEALDYAHRREMIHRDIKPSNIMMTREGWVYLTDFGLARNLSHTADLTRTGTVLGTPEYLSPEQAEGRTSLEPSSDLYSLGIVAYEMLSGTLPFDADTPMGVLAARLSRAPRPLHEVCPHIPPAVSTVVMQALAREPQDRFGSAGEMVTALQQAAEGAEAQPGPATVASTGETIALSPATAPDPEPAQSAPQARPGLPADSQAHQRKRRVITVVMASALALVLALVAGVVSLTASKQPPIPQPTTTPPPLTPSTPQEEALLETGWTAFERGEYAKAEQAFRDVLDLSHTSAAAASANEGLGWLLREQAETLDDYQASLARFQASLALREGKASTHNGMGWCLYDMRDYHAALTHFRRAASLDPAYANAHYGLGRTLEELGRIEEARAAYSEVLRLQPEHEEAQSGLTRIRVK